MLTANMKHPSLGWKSSFKSYWVEKGEHVVTKTCHLSTKGIVTEAVRAVTKMAFSPKI